MNLVDEENRAMAPLAIETGIGNCPAEIFDAGENGRERDEPRVCFFGEQARQSGLAGARRTPENQ